MVEVPAGRQDITDGDHKIADPYPKKNYRKYSRWIPEKCGFPIGRINKLIFSKSRRLEKECILTRMN
jgi:hypothetical protein